MQIASTITLLLLLCAPGKTEQPKCGADLKVPFVSYCDLVRNPGEYDGHPVETEAVWQLMIHTGALADRGCSTSSPELLLVLPSFSNASNSKDPTKKRLSALLKTDRAARVRLIGTFHDLKGRFYSDGQKFQIDIKCLVNVSPLTAAELER